MNDTVTILGRVGGDLNRSETPGGTPVVNFRVASPQSRYDSKTQTWLETGTNWYNVSAFRQLADHAKASLRSGDGVIITGKLKLREWESGGKRGMSADIDADSIGHDLRWGASAFIKARAAAAPSSSQGENDAAPMGQTTDSDAGEFADAPPSGVTSELVDAAGVWGSAD